MIDFEPPEEVVAIRSALREFVAREVEPLERKLARELSDERFLLGDDGFLVPPVVDAVKRIRRASAKAGWYAMHMPAEAGGAGVSKVASFFAWREVMRRPLGLNLNVLGFVEGPTPLFLRLTPAQRERWLSPLVRGEASSAFCLTEPGAGSDVGALATRATRKGDRYVLDGTKTFVTNGPYADFYQVFARTGDDGLAGISCFIVERGASGLSLGRSQLSLVADGAQCEVVLDGVEVPAEQRVGDEGEGFALAIGNIADTRVSIGGLCVGLAEFLVDRMAAYAREREAFGKPIGKQGQLQYYLAESATELYAMENLVLNCCWRMDRGLDVVKESSMAKLYATEALFRIADRAIQLHGGVGLMRELPLERIFRFARVLRIPEGTSEIQRWTIAKALGV